MNTHSRLAVLAAASAALAASASAQSLLQARGNVVATNGDPIPDANGAPIAGLSFGGAGALGDNAVIDESGRLLFRARLTGGTQTATTERAYFYGSSRADLRLVARGGDQAPGLLPGVVLASAGGAVPSLAASVRLSPDGRMWWAALLSDPVNGSVTTQNDEAVFGGPFGAQTMFVRQGDPAPGTAGATFVQAFASPNVDTAGVNREGRLYFHGTLTGGDVSGTSNQGGIWAGFPGALQLVARRGSPIPGAPGLEAAATSLALGSFAQMNDAGRLLWQATLSTTAGATDATDTALFVHTPGGVNTVLVREGDVVPGTSGATFNAIAGEGWAPGVGPSSWTSAGTTIFETELRGGDVASGINDAAIVRVGGGGAPVIVARRGAAAPGTNAHFVDWNPSSLDLASTGQACFQATIEGGSSTQADDTGLWTGMPGALQLVVREGATLPAGANGGIAGHLNGAQVAFNELGQILFAMPIVGGTSPGNALWMYDPVAGLQLVVRAGESFEATPGVLKDVASFGWVAQNATSGAALGFGHDGRIALRLAFTDSTGAIVMIGAGTGIVAPVPYCFGDGSGNACPCGNSGAAGRGCANSVNASGAQLVASGIARLSADTLHLAGNGMPNSSALYFQGTSQQSGGLGVGFGDGLRCAGGSIVRLATKSNVGGASEFPVGADPRVSVRGLVAAPGVRTYQVWYRNAAAYCTSSTYNLSNAVQVTWIP